MLDVNGVWVCDGDLGLQHRFSGQHVEAAAETVLLPHRRTDSVQKGLGASGPPRLSQAVVGDCHRGAADRVCESDGGRGQLHAVGEVGRHGVVEAVWERGVGRLVVGVEVWLALRGGEGCSRCRSVCALGRHLKSAAAFLGLCPQYWRLLWGLCLWPMVNGDEQRREWARGLREGEAGEGDAAHADGGLGGQLAAAVRLSIPHRRLKPVLNLFVCQIKAAVTEAPPISGSSRSGTVCWHETCVWRVGRPLPSLETGTLRPPSTALTAGESILPPHLRVTRGAPREQVVRGLAAEAGLPVLLAAGPAIPQQSPRVVVHHHVLVEVAGCRETGSREHASEYAAVYCTAQHITMWVLQHCMYCRLCGVGCIVCKSAP